MVHANADDFNTYHAQNIAWLDEDGALCMVNGAGELAHHGDNHPATITSPAGTVYTLDHIGRGKWAGSATYTTTTPPMPFRYDFCGQCGTYTHDAGQCPNEPVTEPEPDPTPEPTPPALTMQPGEHIEFTRGTRVLWITEEEQNPGTFVAWCGADCFARGTDLDTVIERVIAQGFTRNPTPEPALGELGNPDWNSDARCANCRTILLYNDEIERGTCPECHLKRNPGPTPSGKYANLPAISGGSHDHTAVIDAPKKPAHKPQANRATSQKRDNERAERDRIREQYRVAAGDDAAKVASILTDLGFTVADTRECDDTPVTIWHDADGLATVKQTPYTVKFYNGRPARMRKTADAEFVFRVEWGWQKRGDFTGYAAGVAEAFAAWIAHDDTLGGYGYIDTGEQSPAVDPDPPANAYTIATDTGTVITQVSHIDTPTDHPDPAEVIADVTAAFDRGMITASEAAAEIIGDLLTVTASGERKPVTVSHDGPWQYPAISGGSHDHTATCADCGITSGDTEITPSVDGDRAPRCWECNATYTRTIATYHTPEPDPIQYDADGHFLTVNDAARFYGYDKMNTTPRLMCADCGTFPTDRDGGLCMHCTRKQNDFISGITTPEPEPTAPDSPEALAATILAAHPLSVERANAAHQWSSFSPEKRAAGHLADYANTIERAAAGLWPHATTPEQRAILAAKLDDFARMYNERYTAWLSALSRTASTMITGGSNFNHRRNSKALDIERRRCEELNEWTPAALKRILKALDAARTPEQAADAAFNALRKEIDKDLATIEAIERGELRYQKTPWVTGIAGRIQRAHKRGELDAVRRALAHLDAEQTRRGIKGITKRHSIWKLA